MSTLNRILFERNLLYQQLSFKWNSYLYLRKLVGVLHSRKTTGTVTKTLLTFVLFLVYSLDFILGAVLLTVVHMYPILRVWLKEYISLYTISMLHWTKELIVWIMGIPAGLKLNTPLDHFLGHRFLSILELWEYFYSDFISTSLAVILPVILLFSAFGLTVSLTALHDFLKFLNLCLVSFFIFAGRFISLQISALKSLARLFMGKKWNILRKRVDSCNYDTSQLLVGTIIFTILLFLLPTTGVYFVIFFVLRWIQFGLQLVLRLHAVVINRLTIGVWRSVVYIAQEQPLTKLKMSVEISTERHLHHTSGDVIDKSELHHSDVIDKGEQIATGCIQLYWNGREHSVGDITRVIDGTPVSGVLKELDNSSQMFDDILKYDHAMLNFIGVLPWFGKS